MLKNYPWKTKYHKQGCNSKTTTQKAVSFLKVPILPLQQVSWNAFLLCQDGSLSSPKSLFPWCKFVDNYMVPSFDTGSVYNSLPGTSIMETAYPKQFSWNTKWLPVMPENITMMNHISNSLSTDVFKLAIFKGAHYRSCDDIEKTESDQLRVSVGNGTVWPGLVSYIEGIACDQLNQSVSSSDRL